MDVHVILNEALHGFDEDLLSYIISVVESMSDSERRCIVNLQEVIGPFLIDSNYVENENEVEEICQKLSISFGGSGMKNTSGYDRINQDLDDPVLLSAPVKMNQKADLLKPASTSTFLLVSDRNTYDPIAQTNNAFADTASSIQTQKDIRKQRKENEALQKILKAEQKARAEAYEEMARARIAAIKASRGGGGCQTAALTIDRFSITHPSGTGELLTDASMTLVPGRRYGLIGRNGAGKSTLLRELANYKLEGLSHLRILMVDQHVEGDDASALEWVLKSDVERTSLLEEEQRLVQFMHGPADGEEMPDDLKGINFEVALSECYERMDIVGVSSSEQRAKEILYGLGFTDTTMIVPTSSLSGGWAMRAALGGALFVSPNLLLLDEPTNHLDLHALVWLEAWLLRFDGIALIVSHDTCFLNSVCTDILELRSVLAGQKKTSLEHYSGDYQSYEINVQERKTAQMRARLAYEREKEKLKEFVSREGKKYDNPQHQAQRKMRMKQLQSMVEVEAVEEDNEIVLNLPKPYCRFDPKETLIRLFDVSFGWSQEGPSNLNGNGENDSSLLLEHVELAINAGSRMVFLGKNGCGKTTLLNLITGKIKPTTGEIMRHVGSRITMLQQHHYKGEQLDPNKNAVEHIRALDIKETSATNLETTAGTRHEETSIRGYLANFGVIGYRAVIPVKYLSGGQRMRVALALALVNQPDVLILDEPTNHLDTVTADALFESLQSFEGCVIAVSHDESFVNRVITPEKQNQSKSGSKSSTATAQDDISPGEIYVVSKRNVKRFNGNFQDYKNIIRKSIVKKE